MLSSQSYMCELLPESYVTYASVWVCARDVVIRRLIEITRCRVSVCMFAAGARHLITGHPNLII